MDEDYDVIVMGTGLKECILSGLLSSVAKKKVLHVDRNPYYGGESASLNLERLFEQFDPQSKPTENLGRSKEYNVDLCPKFIMACGDLVKILLHTKVTRYLEFKSVTGSYVFKDGRIYKVPVTPKEALNSSLMGIFQKRRFRNFVLFVNDFKEGGQNQGLKVENMTMREIFKYFRCDDNTIAFTGHALALHLDDSYLDDKSKTVDFIKRVQLYADSLARYGNSPYIYPLWGLGGLPEGFSRLCAIHGGTYMLNRPVDEILYDDSGKVRGIKSQGEEARAKQVIGDPSYFMGTKKITKQGQVARWLFILNHPVPGTADADSLQIIIPAKQTRRKTDIYVSVVSGGHQVVPKGKWVAMVSCIVETSNPKAEMSVAAGLLGRVEKDFFFVRDYFVPTNDGVQDQAFVSRSFDATTHFQTDAAEVLQLYEKITGTQLDMTIKADLEEEQ